MKTTSEYHKTCPECEEPFEAQRLNQHYCTKKCKSRFNNRKARRLKTDEETNHSITQALNQQLWLNREVLRQIGEQSTNEEIPLSTFKKMGFKTNYITQFKKASNQKKTFFYCYDYGYQFVNNNTLQIIKR